MHLRRLSILSFATAVLLLVGLLAPGAWWNAVQSARANTLTVNSLSDTGSTCSSTGTTCLREAINSAASNDTIQFSVTGMITLSRGVLTITRALTINGPGVTLLVINANHSSEVINVGAFNINIHVSNVTIQNGSGLGGVGGAINNQGALYLNNVLVTGSSCSQYGGGIDNNGGSLFLTNTTVSGNSCNQGGGIFNDGGVMTLTYSAISGNTSTNGGGIYHNGGTMIVTNSTISGNIVTGSTGSGGGIFFNGSGGGSMTLTGATISGNTASNGGGIDNYNGTMTFSNGTLANNTANNGSGGALYNGGSSTSVTITNSTVAGNSATSAGGGFFLPVGTVTLHSNIIANNNSGPGPDIYGTVVSQGSNLIGNTTDTSGLVSSDLKNINPKLNALALNPLGATQTMSLQSGSPAITKGNCALTPAVTADQRGIHRKNQCDIGAYETPGTPTETVGLYSPLDGQFYLKNSNAAGAQDFLFSYGPAPSTITPLVGDWTGQGIKTPGLYDPAGATFYLRNSNSGGNADIVFQFGQGGAGWIPIVGDWIGQGHDGVGLYDPSTGTFYLKNGLGAGNADFAFTFGPANANLMPIAGDWLGQGFSTVGLFSQANAYFYLRYSNSSGNADLAFQYGPATGNGGPAALPIIGRWVGQLSTTIGVYVPANAYYYLKNTNAAGNADNQFQFGPGPNAGWLPVMGHWTNPGPHIDDWSEVS